MAAPAFVPEDPAWYQVDPDAAFGRLRAEDPLHWYDAGGFWCVTKHADVQLISQRPRQFSSLHGTQLFEVRHPVRKTKTAPTAGGVASIIRMDPPEHNRYRKLVIGAFTPKRIEAMEGWIREIACESLDALDADVVEFVDQVAVPMPMFVIAELLGVPREDHAAFRRWSDVMVEAGGGQLGPHVGEVVRELATYVMGVAAERRHEPQDDLISNLVAAELDGEHLSDREIASFCLTLLVAGNETTRNLVSGGALALMRNPAQRERLLAEPELLPNAVEEMLRYVSPVRNFVRCALEDAELRGREIRRGEYVALFYGSANRDEEVFGADADAFDIARESARRHVAFGFGEHFCLGASLARLEAKVLFEELLRRWPAFELAGEPVPLESSLMNGWVRMPVRLAP